MCGGLTSKHHATTCMLAAINGLASSLQNCALPARSSADNDRSTPADLWDGLMVLRLRDPHQRVVELSSLPAAVPRPSLFVLPAEDFGASERLTFARG